MRVWLPNADIETLRIMSLETGLTQSLIAQLLCRAGIQAIKGKSFTLPFKFNLVTGVADGIKPVPRKIGPS